MEYVVLPPRLPAGLYGVLAQLHGVHFDRSATDLAGRTWQAFYILQEGYIKNEIIVNPKTYAYMGQQQIAIRARTCRATDGVRHVSKGHVLGWSAVLSSGIVQHAGDGPAQRVAANRRRGVARSGGPGRQDGPPVRYGRLSGRAACQDGPGSGSVTSATVAPRIRTTSSALAAMAAPCSPAPSVTCRPAIRSSAMTGHAVLDPSGVIVPRAYPVAAWAVAASGMDSRPTPSSARSLGQEMFRSPGTSTNR